MFLSFTHCCSVVHPLILLLLLSFVAGICFAHHCRQYLVRPSLFFSFGWSRFRALFFFFFRTPICCFCFFFLHAVLSCSVCLGLFFFLFFFFTPCLLLLCSYFTHRSFVGPLFHLLCFSIFSSILLSSSWFQYPPPPSPSISLSLACAAVPLRGQWVCCHHCHCFQPKHTHNHKKKRH